MRIVLVTVRDVRRDVRGIALARSLRLVGHEVVTVSGGIGEGEDGVVFVPRAVPARRGRERAARRLGLHRAASFGDRFVEAAAAALPDVVYALNEPSIEIAEQAARRADAALVCDPRWRVRSEFDIVHRAPHESALSESPSGPGIGFHTDDDRRDPWHPEDGRHRGRKLVFVYRRTPTNPGRYLEAAARRSGMTVIATDSLDWASIDEDTDAVVFVESPHPAATVTGTNPGVPVLLWIHHGEIHTNAHLRLVRRYAPDAVLMGHSWHLAHRFPLPVHRFPFAVPTELVDAGRPFEDRAFDSAFVGSLGHGERYAERRAMVQGIVDALGADAVRLAEGVSPEELASIYGDSRTVVNDGGVRHHPITMRVFEAIGSGAALVTEPTPGLDCLFAPDRDFLDTDATSMVPSVIDLLRSGDRASAMAASALERAVGRHTYDHRIDELLEIVDASSREPATWNVPVPSSALGSAVDRAIEIDSVAAYGSPGLDEDLVLRSVWVDPEPGVRTYDAVVLGAEVEFDPAMADQAVRYLIVDPVHEHPAIEWARSRPGSRVTTTPRAVIFDLDAPGYRVRMESA